MLKDLVLAEFEEVMRDLVQDNLDGEVNVVLAQVDEQLTLHEHLAEEHVHEYVRIISHGIDSFLALVKPEPVKLIKFGVSLFLGLLQIIHRLIL